MDESAKNLKKETIISLLWNAFDKVGFQIIAFVIGLVTLRLLSPRDFGLIGALAIFTALSNILIESGFTSAMVRRSNNTNQEYSAIFCFNIIISILFYLLLYIFAGKIADYYQMEELIDLSRFLFLSIVFNSFGIVQNIILTKQLAFKKLSLSNICGAIISGAVTIILILRGYTYWALAWQIFLQAAIKSVMLWLLSDWKPTEKPDFKIIKELFTFSFSLILSSIINTFVRYIYNPIIGKYFGEEELGYYSEAYKFYYLPSSIIANTICGVSYPVLSKLNDEKNRQMVYIRKMIRIIAFGIFPIMLGAMACFDNLVTIVLTDKWKDIIPYFQILAIAGLAVPFHAFYLGVITLKGYPKTILKLEMIRNALIILPLFFLHKNINWMLWSFSIANIISLSIDMIALKRITSYRIISQLKDIFPYCLIALTMAGMVYAINFTNLSIITQAILQIVIGFLFYIGTCYLSGSAIVKEMLNNLLSKVGLLRPK